VVGNCVVVILCGKLRICGDVRRGGNLGKYGIVI